MIFEDWGLIDYQVALDKQLHYVDHVTADPQHPGYLIFCTHPAVVTTGRQTQPDDIFDWPGPVIEVSRGGRATYHGPSQVVVYPILNLKATRHDRGPQEIRGFIRSLEHAIIQTLKNYNITAIGKIQTKEESNLQDTGVWIESKKVASIGIAVRRWVSFHGAAINVFSDRSAFQGLNPCGYEPSIMISLEDHLQKKIDGDTFKEILKMNCQEYL